MGLLDWVVRRFARARVQMMGGGLDGNYRQDAYQNAVVRETVDAIARHAAKLNAVHLCSGVRQHDGMQYLIGMRPNPAMSAYDFQYKLIATALLKNNAYALPVWRRGRLIAIIPVDYMSTEILEDEKSGETYVRFMLINGKETILPYAELIHLRRHFSKWVIEGSGNAPLDGAVEMINTANAGMMSAVRSGSSLRGVLKIKQAQLKNKDIVARRNDFIREYMEGTSGVAALDQSMDYQQLDPSKMYSLTDAQMAAIRGNVYRYYGVSEKFVRGEYSEDDFNATYEAVIEPLALQLHMEYTHKLFTQSERERGETVIFEAKRLQYASVKTKVEVVNRMGMLGVVTFDEAREIFNLAPLPDGQGARLIPPWNGETEAKKQADPNVGEGPDENNGEGDENDV